MSETNPLRGLNLYARFCVGSVIFLIVLGAIVTSKGAGLAVPDWPQSYGYNMFLFPYSRWVGGIFWEHTHRLVASGIGVMTIILTIWIWKKDSRKWMKGLGLFALFLVIFQGILGGGRVVWLKDGLGLIHGCTAQLFLAVIGSIALFTSRLWNERKRVSSLSRGSVKFVAFITILVFLQLTFGATMRHAHKGLSILDFPKAYGSWWPHVTQDQIPEINQERRESGHPETTLMLIHLQMGHRFLAYLLTVLILMMAWKWGSDVQLPSELRMASKIWGASVLFQVTLGACTILTDRGFEVTSAHVALGAWTLLMGVLITIYAGSIAEMWGKPQS
ncbi:MAG: COX15/CtaA family protein [Verrucomicrobiota bacterium]